MIKIKRYAPEELGVDQDLIKRLKEETEKAKLHYDNELKKYKADNNYKIKSFSFKTYGKTKRDLINIYNGKCAYCEESILQGQPGDVEHFRPKSAINTKLDGIQSLSDAILPPGEDEVEIKPGYYWLAADWYNLLLSCNSCNRVSKQLNTSDMEDTTVASDTIEEETLGKGTRFPYVDISKRIADPDIPISEESKVRLLIDPGEDNPEEHLTFVKYEGKKVSTFESNEIETEEKFGMIKPLTDKGVASIQIFGLARWRLLQEREKAALHLMRGLTDLKNEVTQYIASIKELENNPTNSFAEMMKANSLRAIPEKMKVLTSQFKNSSPEESPSPFLGMKKVIVRNWIEEENQIVSELFNRGIDIERLLIMDLIKDLNFLRRLCIDHKIAIDSGDNIIQQTKEKVIEKVWSFLHEELKPGAPHITSKKSLIKVWIEKMTEKEPEIIATLKALNKDPGDLID